MKIALITGIRGQDGSYLAEMLLDFGYHVHGIIRPNNSTDRFETLEKLEKQNIKLYTSDICDTQSLIEILNSIRPDEIYHLAAQSHVGLSFQMPEYTHRVNSEGTSSLYSAIIRTGLTRTTKIYNAATSELFGNLPAPQNEDSGFQPRSPYAVSKLSAYWSTVNMRNYEVYAVSGILFNHESPRRNPTFVTRKIVRQLAEIISGERKTFSLGNLSAKRDWGYAAEYVYAMWKMLQGNEPIDYVIGTGETHSVQEFLLTACKYANLDINSKFMANVDLDIRQLRPNEVNLLQADPRLAISDLGWAAEFKFIDLVHLMVDQELKSFGLPSPGLGFNAVKRLSKIYNFKWLLYSEGLLDG